MQGVKEPQYVPTIICSNSWRPFKHVIAALMYRLNTRLYLHQNRNNYEQLI